MTLGGSLTGCVVLITSDRRSAELRAACEHRGAEVVHAPALSHTAHFADDHLARATRQLVARPADTVVLTTGSGFLGWLEAADAIGLETELLASLRGARIIARGPSAHGAAVGVGLDVDPGMVPESATGARDLLLTDGVRGRRVAVQHQGAVSEALDADLAMAGADVVSLVAHPWGPAPDPVAVTLSVQEAAVGNIDAALFTSAPAACAWVDAAREADVLASISARATAGTLTVMAVGPVTARPLLEAGITPHQPEQPRLGALVRSLVEHYEGVGTSSVQTPS